MRRGSVIGPLILIGIGGLFLMRNLWPEIPLVDIISRYWPFLLIAWGGLRLIEILFWAIISKPIPRNGISPGEWMLVFLICIIGGTMYTARHYAAWFPARSAWRGVVMGMGESYDYTLPSGEKPCAKNCRLMIESFRGNAKITGTTDSVVKVSGHETVRAFQQAEADRANKETPLELVEQGDELIVRTNQDRVSDRTQVSDDLEITIPAGASVEAHGRYGDFDIQNVNGSLDINSDNAGVRLENIGGNVRIDLRAQRYHSRHRSKREYRPKGTRPGLGTAGHLGTSDGGRNLRRSGPVAESRTAVALRRPADHGELREGTRPGAHRVGRVHRRQFDWPDSAQCPVPRC